MDMSNEEKIEKLIEIINAEEAETRYYMETSEDFANGYDYILYDLIADSRRAILDFEVETTVNYLLDNNVDIAEFTDIKFIEGLFYLVNELEGINVGKYYHRLCSEKTKPLMEGLSKEDIEKVRSNVDCYVDDDLDCMYLDYSSDRVGLLFNEEKALELLLGGI